MASQDGVDSLPDEHTDSFSRADSVVHELDVDDDLADVEVGGPIEEHQIRTQTALFHAWVIKQAASDLKAKRRGPKDGPQENFASVSDIISNQESAQIIESPRQYQQELFERAKSENTIAVLDTGAGKTLIAVLLLRHILDQELEDRAAGKPHRIAFFLVPSLNLVFQQYAVLESNLDHEITRVYGAMNVDLWTREKWLTLFSQHKIVVCTAEILHKCLGHGFIRMDQLNLLIFDEAHHAKLQHPYSKIMRDYYISLDGVGPRIFGMTASPIDIKSDGDDVLATAEELEATLFSRIATAKDLAALQNNVHRPLEKEQAYAKVPQPSETNLTSEIMFKYGHLSFLRKLATKAASINAHLGRWCADAYWKLALPERIDGKSEVRLEKMAGSNVDGGGAERRDRSIAETKEVLSFVGSTAPAPVVRESDDISRKVEALLRILVDDFFQRENDYRCIVFVEQRYTAKLLAMLLSSLDHGFVRAGALVGTSPSDFLSAGTTFRDQVLTLLRFRRGDLNCLFATSVAEEGLDIPDCNLIIRFDPCKTMIQYVQSRGRARHRNSTFIHMTEMGNPDHRMMMEDNHKAEMTMKRFCNALKEDRRLIGDQDLEAAGSDMNIKPYVIKETGAKLTASNCVPILSQFCSTLNGEDAESLRPVYVVQAVHNGFQCEIVMPPSSPIRGQVGLVKRRKIHAKCSAAFHVCADLLQKGYLDKNMLPIYDRSARNMAHIKLAEGMYGTASGFVMRHKPHFWQAFTGVSDELYGTYVNFRGSLGRPNQPVMILSRSRMPDLARFPIYPEYGVETKVELSSSSQPIKVEQNFLTRLTEFNLVMFDDVFGKKYELNVPSMSYWIVPMLSSGEQHSDFTAAIDHAAIDFAANESPIRWRPDMSTKDLESRYLIDIWVGGVRYFTEQVDHTLKPTDTNPCPPPKKAGNFVAGSSIIDTTVRLFKKSRQRAIWNEQQPVLKAKQATLRRDFLAPIETAEKADRYICPEPLRISRLTSAFATTAYAIPSIMHRVESYLVALEGCASLGLQIPASLALEAVTKDSNAVEEVFDEEQNVIYQKGMGRNYERLELYGDTFLKMTTTIAVYIKNPGDDEFDYHCKRMVQICNKNLYEVALKRDLPQFIRNKALHRRTWYPEGLTLLQGKGANRIASSTESLGKKTIADVSEAIVGAALCADNKPGNWRPEHWKQAIHAVTELVQSDTHDMQEWDDYKRAYTLPKWQTLPPRAAELELVEKISKEDSYRFKNARLLRAAFTHGSMSVAQENTKCYEQLEFLGDALIDMACVSHLFYKFPDKDPGWLTEHKMAMIGNKFFAAVAVKLGFHRHLRHSTASLGKQVMAYRMEIEEAEEASGGAKDYWTTVKDPPKALADILEAYVGALFLDSDFDYNQVQRFFDTHMLPYFEDMEIYDRYASGHPVTKLHQLLQISFGCRNFRLMVEEVPTNDDGTDQAIAGVIIHSKVIGGDSGQSSRYAKIRAAQKAYREINGMPVSMFRARFGCDCRAEEIDGDEVMADTSDGDEINGTQE